MRLLLIRHAEAADVAPGPSLRKHDAARRLTDEGRKAMRKIARGLRTIAARIDVLATSPLVRAHETAEIVADVFRVEEISVQSLLAPGADKSALVAWLQQCPADATVAVVGHEPDLSAFAGLLVWGRETSVLVLKKGACCSIEFDASPRAGGGTLRWLLQPAQLRRLAD